MCFVAGQRVSPSRQSFFRRVESCRARWTHYVSPLWRSLPGTVLLPCQGTSPGIEIQLAIGNHLGPRPWRSGNTVLKLCSDINPKNWIVGASVRAALVMPIRFQRAKKILLHHFRVGTYFTDSRPDFSARPFLEKITCPRWRFWRTRHIRKYKRKCRNLFRSIEKAGNKAM